MIYKKQHCNKLKSPFYKIKKPLTMYFIHPAFQSYFGKRTMR